MNPFPDSWIALFEYHKEILILLTCIGWGGLITFAVLSCVGGRQWDLSETISLALSGWVLPVLPLSILIWGSGIFLDIHPDRAAISILAAAGLALALWTWMRAKARFARGPGPVPFLLAILFPVFLSFRLAFIAHILVPPYFDSAQHYLIIRNLVLSFENTGGAGGFSWPIASYYHIGFHIMIAVLTSLFQANAMNMILAMGQIVLAAVPIPLFMIVRHETRSDLAGLLAVMLGAFGWYMPAFSMNWGKYPALFSLLPIQFTLGAVYLAGDPTDHPGRSRTLIGMAILGTGISFLIHTRSIIILGMVCASWIIAKHWARRPALQRILLTGLAIMILAVECILVGQNDILNALLDPYFHSGIWVTGLVGLFTLTALLKYPRMALSILLTIMLLLAGLFVPVPFIPYSTLLDRPLVEMLLFMPLAVLGGVGCAGLFEFFRTIPDIYKATGIALLSGAILVQAIAIYGFQPSDCCSIVNRDDLVAFDWMDKNLADHARLLIPASDRRFSISPASAQVTTSDAGIWILPMTGRQTIDLFYGTDFSLSDTLEAICQQGVNDIYVGSSTQSFMPGSLDKKPEWYKLVLFLPAARIYQVTGCANQPAYTPEFPVPGDRLQGNSG